MSDTKTYKTKTGQLKISSCVPPHSGVDEIFGAGVNVHVEMMDDSSCIMSVYGRGEGGHKQLEARFTIAAIDERDPIEIRATEVHVEGEDVTPPDDWGNVAKPAKSEFDTSKMKAGVAAALRAHRNDMIALGQRLREALGSGLDGAMVCSHEEISIACGDVRLTRDAAGLWWHDERDSRSGPVEGLVDYTATLIVEAWMPWAPEKPTGPSVSDSLRKLLIRKAEACEIWMRKFEAKGDQEKVETEADRAAHYWCAVAQLNQRTEVGRAEYGDELRVDTPVDGCVEALDELSDAMVYIRKAQLAGNGAEARRLLLPQLEVLRWLLELDASEAEG